jgi:hypothetical protein
MTRRHAAVFVMPLIVGLVSAQHLVPHMRTVDFLTLFASGTLFGVGLMGVIQALRSGRRSEP